MNILFWKHISTVMISSKLDIINPLSYPYEKGRTLESKTFSLALSDYRHNINNIFLHLGLEC